MQHGEVSGVSDFLIVHLLTTGGDRYDMRAPIFSEIRGREGRSGRVGPASAQAEEERGDGVGSRCGMAWPIAGRRRKGKRRRGGVAEPPKL